MTARRRGEPPRRRTALAVLAGLLAPVLLAAGCASEDEGSGASSSVRADGGTSEDAQGSPGSQTTPEVVQARVMETIPREPTFTQGLETLPDGSILHSRGRYGSSGVDILAPSGEVVRSRDLPRAEFGEGITVVPGQDGSEATAYQLTWKSGVVRTWSVPDLDPGETLRIDGEGWGLCYDATREVLWQSDGSARLRALRPPDLSPLETVEITEQGTPVEQLNELECVGGAVWANVWRSNDLVMIDPQSGRVTRRVELDALVAREGATASGDVLNGIATSSDGDGSDDDGSDDETLLVTGKNWEHLYRIDVGPLDGS